MKSLEEKLKERQKAMDELLELGQELEHYGLDVCPVCGENMSGGHSFGIPSHCPNASEDKWWYKEQDSGPWYCDEDDEYESDNPLERPW